MFVTTPSLEIANSWRTAALPIGIALMILVGFLHIFRFGRFWTSILALGTVAAAVAITALLGPYLQGLGNWNLLIFFVLGVGSMVLLGVPIAFSFGLETFAYLALTTSTPTVVVVGRMDEGMSHLILLAVRTSCSWHADRDDGDGARDGRLFGGLLGHVRGGLSYVLIGAMYLVSGNLGSKAADMAAIAPVLFPEMKRRGAKPGDLVALLSATGAQTRDPAFARANHDRLRNGRLDSGALYRWAAAGRRVGLLLAALVWWRYRNQDLSGGSRLWSQDWQVIPDLASSIALPFIIRAAVIEGVATATEVSTIGIAYTVLAGLLVYRQFDWKRIYPMLVDTASLSGSILLIIGAATGMAWALTQSGFSSLPANSMKALPGGTSTFLAVSVLAFVVLGSVLEGIPAIVLFGPLLFPIARQVGVHEVHYAMVVVLAMGIGLFAPPFGVGYYAACAISRINPMRE